VRACVCVCVCACARACRPSTCSHLSVKHGDSHHLRTRSHRHRVIKHTFLSPLQHELWKSVHPVVCLHGAANFPPTPPLCPGLSRHTQGRFLMTPVLSDAVRGAWAGLRRAASSSYQTLSQFFPQHYSLHPRSPKPVCPDKRVCLAFPPSFRPGSWLCGSGQALILNFPNFRSGVCPAAPFPAPPHHLTPQGCMICKSGSLCKFWGRGGGLGGPAHTGVNFGGKTLNLGASPHDWGFAKNVCCSAEKGNHEQVA